MYLPAQHDEPTTHAEYVRQLAESLRASAYGLTEEQARLTPCRSALSIGGLLKHLVHVYAEVVGAEVVHPDRVPADPVEAFMASFTLREDETLTLTLARFDEVMEALVENLRTADPGEVVEQPAMPWFGVDAPARVCARYQHVHVVEELARHAGHADIVREQIDGATSPELLLAVWGQPGNDFVQPWRPAGERGA